MSKTKSNWSKILTWCKPVLIMWNWSTSFLCRGRISGCTSFSWTASPTPRMCTCLQEVGYWDVSPPQFRIGTETEPYLFLHQILQMCDPLRILGVTADIVLIKEGLQRRSQKMRIKRHRFINKVFRIKRLVWFALPPDIWQCRRLQRRLWLRLGTCWAGWCCRGAACADTGWSECAAPGFYSPQHKWRSPEGSPPPEGEKNGNMFNSR